MADSPRVVIPSAALVERSKGQKFIVQYLGEPAQGFALRYEGRVYAYLNRCAHLGVGLDWQEKEFFDHSGLYLVCATHGALYQPETGLCVSGPCVGKALVPLNATEIDGKVYVTVEREHAGTR